MRQALFMAKEMGKGMGKRQILFGQMQKNPLILTLRLDEESQAFFNMQRKRYFPPERNFMDAHLMLFHQLPNSLITYDYLAKFCCKLFSLQVTGLMNLGAGVAYRIESAEISALHKSLRSHFLEILILQDLHGFRPHITIFNKSTLEKARTLIAELSPGFQPFHIQAIGLDLWTYLNGPWQYQRSYLFNTTA
jgi:hypothetical protein